MNNFVFYSPTEFVFGKDTEMQVGALAGKYGARKVMIVYGGGSVLRSGLLDRVKQSLQKAGIRYCEMGGVQPNPVDTKVYEGIEICRREHVYPHSESFHLLCEIFLLLYTRIHLLCEKIRLFLFFFRLIFADFTIDFEKNKLFKIREDSSITALSCFIFINICFFNLLYIIIYIKTQGTSYGY